MLRPENKTNSPDVSIAFVVGMSRSGTTWVTKCLNESSSFAAVGETGFWGRYFVKPSSDGFYSTQELQAAKSVLIRPPKILAEANEENCGYLKSLNRDDFSDFIETHLDQLQEPISPGVLFTAYANAISKSERALVFVEKTPHHINYVDRILAHVPHAKFLVSIRDPCGFVLSYKHLGNRKKPLVRDRLRRLYHPAVCALIWRGYARAASRLANAHSDAVVVVDYAELASEPAATLKTITAHFGAIEETSQLMLPRDNSSFDNTERPELSQVERAWVRLIGNRDIQRLGYKVDPVEWAPLGFIVSLVRLPLVLTRNLLNVSRKRFGAAQYLLNWAKHMCLRANQE